MSEQALRDTLVSLRDSIRSVMDREDVPDVPELLMWFQRCEAALDAPIEADFAYMPLVTKCTVCTPFREALNKIGADLSLRAEIGQDYPQIDMPAVKCRACNGENEVLTAEGERLKGALLRGELPKLNDVLERLKAFAVATNREAAEKHGLSETIPF